MTSIRKYPGIRKYQGKTLTSYEYTLYLGRDPMTGKPKQEWYGGFCSAEEAAAHRALQISTLKQQKALARIQAIMPGVPGIAVQGMPITPAPVTIKLLPDFLSEWERDSVAYHVEDTTADNYHEDIQYYIIPWLGHHYLHELVQLIIQKWTTSLSENGRKDGTGLAPSTVGRALTTLKTALKYAKDMKLITENPADGVKPPRIEYPKQDGIPIEDVQAICDHAQDTRWHTPIVVTANTGMRRSEILGLKWQRVDFEAQTLAIESVLVSTNAGPQQKKKTKSRAGNRIVTLDQMTLDELLKHQNHEKGKFRALGKRWSNEELVFTNDAGGNYYPDSLTNAFKRIAKATGFPDLHLHDLRHAHISNLLSAGVPVLVVADRVGHSDPTMTLKVYGHVIPSDRAKAINTQQALINPRG